MATLAPDRIGGVVALAPLVLPEVRLEHLLFGPRSVPGPGDLLAATARASSDRLLFPSLWRAMFLPEAMPQRMRDAFPFALAAKPAAVTRVAEDAMAANPDLLRLIASAAGCRVPVRILGGDRDLVVRNGAHGKILAALMPNAAYADLPGMGHMIHHFAAQQVLAAVEDITIRREPPS